ncbi:6-carboxytetrahydropterin synthase [Methyloversatilis sp. XJ19-13]|uniref:6-carboxytetrahydropterin synthase n=1 Tax=Methyloversatilis sp. XJ19-13 TaxID=2963430 RepID=UPI00211BF33C|nr:6-carboxytetrahydropterin synthase [Methyloversatilis sp. XJ19-13]MCQ9373524.1 6-carboxytetrahydropterin synthase [Methyloversatilis sp. XJ19-13]
MKDILLHVAAADFEAARHLEHLPTTHRAHALHGHSFTGSVRAALPEGWGGVAGGEVDALAARLRTELAPLDYRLLNDTVTRPGDENLARWLRGQLDLPEVHAVGVRSTRHAGVQLDGHGDAHVWRRYVFQSAHQLPRVAPGHKCGRMHGHGFEVLLHAKPAPHAPVDHDLLDVLWAPLHAQLHLACLNDIAGLDNPTSENIAAWIWQQLKPALPGLCWVTVYETASCGAQFDGLQHRVWKEFTLDSAVQLKRAPDGDPRRRIHGHTFTLRLHLAASLDPVMGWTVDFGDVKAQFAPLFDRLDHAPLHELMDADGRGADTASLARGIMTLATPLIPSLERLDLHETRGCGVILQRGGSEPTLPV